MYTTLHKPNTFLRVLTLIIILANVAFNFSYDYLGLNLPTMQQMSDKYFNLFAPAGYAFSIWGFIYLAFIVYAVFQLLPSQKKYKVYDTLALPLILINLLGSIWIYVYLTDMILASLLLMALQLILGIIAFLVAKNAVVKHNYSSWLMVPFSLYLGWISVAAIANTTIYLKATGFNGNFFDEPMLAMIMTGIAGLLGLIIGLSQRNFIYPLVIAWAAIAIWYERRDDHANIAYVALGTAIFCIVISLVAMILKRNNKVVLREQNEPLK